MAPSLHPRRPLRAAIAALAVGALALSLTACATGTAGGSSSGAASDDVYRLPITDPGSEIDPLTVADYNAQIISGLVTEPLISLDAAGDLNPRLATDWTASDDGLTWTVTLRDGAVFNDGTPVTSADVVATFQAITGEDSQSPGRSAFDGILDSVAADGDATVVFTLVRPFSDFPLLLTGTNTGILPADYKPGTWLDDPVGAGQFLLKDYTVGKGATYVKNPEYWNADAINASHYSNPELEDLTAQFDATTDPAQRQQLADRIAGIQWTDLPVIVPAFSKAQSLQDKRVKGEFAGALDFYTGYDFSGISIEE
jgi:peptide/nickel transport system substrate-binding protein